MANLKTTNVDGTLSTIGLGASVAMKVYDTGQVEFPEGVIPTESKLVSGTEVTLTNQTFVDFAIPAWAKRITVVFAGVSLSGGSSVLVQLGTQAGIEVTGYTGAGNSMQTAGVVNVSSVAGFPIYMGVANSSLSGGMSLALLGDNKWASSHSVTTLTTNTGCGAGSKTLSDTLTTVRITAVNGTDQFDAGTVNVLYE